MNKKKLEELRKANDALLDQIKKENRELTPAEKELFEARNEVLAFHSEEPPAQPTEKRSDPAAPQAPETRSAPPAPGVAGIVVAETRALELAAVEMKEEAESRAIATALLEKRAVAVGANGDSQFSNRVFEIPGDLTNILNAITMETNAAPNTKFPLFSPNLDNVKRVSEDGTGSTVSTTAFTPVVVTPAPYLAFVPVSDSFLKQNPGGAVAKLAPMFNKQFLRKMAKEIVFGTGSGEMLGVFKDTGITANATTAAPGGPKIVDITALIAKLTGKFLRSELSIVINPIFWGAIMAEDIYHTHVTFQNGIFAFDGVKIFENDNAPTTLTAGSKVAVIGNFTDYGVAVAQNVELRMINPVAGSLNSNLQGVSYFDGKAIVTDSFAYLKTGAQT
ncbi:phage major capsid protein [Treponema zuelzerae]|uniref:Phage major capsid protein n=1 Tax=Teretinema zuelzerae TaxID=156 RepID=A0AAE3EHG7_9SPIR|nr:phage major capsid protein [Teretinema zuelzerae]MCD1654722.1 phage major capsid protein [Teretinema zuelzerae]